MTGNDIQRLRAMLGMTLPHFAQLLGVHMTTAYRWELQGEKKVTLDPLHQSLLLRVEQSVTTRSSKNAREEWGKQLLAGVLLGGTLAGLAILLAELIPDQKGKKRRA